MKIAFFEYFLNLKLEGGSMFSLDLYARKLLERGYDVSIITITSHKNNLGKTEKKPYRMIEENVKDSNPITLDKEAQRILKKYEGSFEVYHIHNPWLLTAAARYRKNGGKTPVVADMNTYMFCTNFALMDGKCHKTCRLYKRIVHSNLSLLKKIASIPVRIYQQEGLDIVGKYIDMFFPVSPFAEGIFTDYGLPKEKMMMIPDGFDLSVFTKKARSSVYKDFNVICASRFDYTKGVDIAIKSIWELQKRGIKNVVLHIVGNDGTEKEGILKMVEELKIKDKIIFHGHLSFKSLIYQYANSQLFVHPARWFETFGRTIVEAMAIGLPVVVSDKGALSWVANGSGLVFKSGRHLDLADKIEKIYSDRKLWKRLSKRSLERARDFDVKNTINGFERAYNTLIKDR